MPDVKIVILTEDNIVEIAEDIAKTWGGSEDKSKIEKWLLRIQKDAIIWDAEIYFAYNSHRYYYYSVSRQAMTDSIADLDSFVRTEILRRFEEDDG